MEVLKKTFGCQNKQELKKAILNNMPLMYNGVENMINRCSQFYGLKIIEGAIDENIHTLFELLGVKETKRKFNMVSGALDGE